MRYARLSNLWYSFRSNFWFVPTLMMAGVAVLAAAVLQVDERLGPTLWRWLPFLYSGEPGGAQAMLSTIAASMVTVVSVTFSITVVVLTMAASTFGPRLLSGFIRDRVNQLSLGVFVSTFVYCMLVSGQVDGKGSLTPRLAVSVGLVLALTSFLVLVYFVHHIAASIRAENVVLRVSRDLEDTMDDLFPEPLGEGEADDEDDRAVVAAACDRFSNEVVSSGTGYVQAVEDESLASIAGREGVSLCVLARPGDFVAAGQTIVLIRPRIFLKEELARELNRQFVLGMQRTPSQDLEYAVLMLVEVAIRALSPGINDAFTAMNCIDRLGAAMVRLAGRRMSSRVRRGDDGEVRLVSPIFDFEGAFRAAFNQIRQSSGGHPAVLARLLESFAVVAGVVRRPTDARTVREHARMVLDEGRRSVPEAADLRDLEAREARVREKLAMRGYAPEPVEDGDDAAGPDERRRMGTGV